MPFDPSRPRYTGRSRPITASLPGELATKLEELATSHHLPLSRVVRELIIAGLEAHGEQLPAEGGRSRPRVVTPEERRAQDAEGQRALDALLQSDTGESQSDPVDS